VTSAIHSQPRAQQVGDELHTERAWELVVESSSAAMIEPRIGLEPACESELDGWEVLDQR
jgi:hypothetical protein